MTWKLLPNSNPNPPPTVWNMHFHFPQYWAEAEKNFKSLWVTKGVRSSGVLKPAHPQNLPRVTCVRLFPTLASVMAPWWLEIDHGMNI